MKAQVNEHFDFSFEDKSFDWDCVEIKTDNFIFSLKGAR